MQQQIDANKMHMTHLNHLNRINRSDEILKKSYRASGINNLLNNNY